MSAAGGDTGNARPQHHCLQQLVKQGTHFYGTFSRVQQAGLHTVQGVMTSDTLQQHN
jgi:hypothetical protein